MGNTEIARTEPKPQHTASDNHSESGSLGSTGTPVFDVHNLMQNADKFIKTAKELGESMGEAYSKWVNKDFEIVDPGKMPTHGTNGPESTEHSGKPMPGDQTATQQGSKQNPDIPADRGLEREDKSLPKVMDQIQELPNNRSSQRPAPPRTAAEAPSDAAITTAIGTIERLAAEGEGRLNPVNGPISDETQTALQALVAGDMSQIQSMLKEMEGDSIGKEKLHAMARELTQILSTTVDVIDNNGQYSLDVLTNFQNASQGGYLGGFNPEKESHLTISSSGEVNAEQRSGSLEPFGIYGKAREADKALNSDTETTRLQALAVNGLAAQVEMANQMATIEKKAQNIQHSQMEKEGPKPPLERPTIERPSPPRGPVYSAGALSEREYKIISEAILNLDK